MKNNVYLRAFELKDLELINKWHNDVNLNSLTCGRKFFVSSLYDRNWIEDKILNNQNQVYCAICEVESNNMIGYSSLNSINYVNKNAFWGGIVIGDYKARNKGYASQAAFQLMKYGFYELGLIKITGKWLPENKISVFMAKNLGFKQEGLLRKDVYKNNQFYDVLIMSILKEEFEHKYCEFYNQ